jgi:hypothetical protein
MPYDIHDLIHTNGYHVVMGFGLLLKMGVVVDVKCRLIQVHNKLGLDV